MSEKSTEKPVAAKKATDTNKRDTDVEMTATEKEKPKFKIEKLRGNSVRLFNVTASTFDGAMYGHKETEMTIEEARTIINKWLGRKE